MSPGIRFVLLWLCLVAASCGTATSSVPPASAARAQEASSEDDSSARSDEGIEQGVSMVGETFPAFRNVNSSQTYRDLVAQVNKLDQRGYTHSEAACILNDSSDPWRLEADLAVASRPIPDPLASIQSMLANVQAVKVHTRWGILGDAARGPQFLALTSTPQDLRKQALIVVLTAKGVYARTTSLAINPLWQGAIRVESLSEVIRKTKSNYEGLFHAVYVAAEADIPMSDVAKVLRAVGALELPAALGVLVGPDVEVLREATAQQEADTGLCNAETWPAIRKGLRQVEPTVSQMDTLREDLNRIGHDCLDHSCGTDVQGGLINLGIRFDAAGHVITACVLSDEMGDIGLRQCLIRAARRIELPGLGGVVSFNVPLRLVHLPTENQRPICE